MTEEERILEVLCTEYFLEDLQERYAKLAGIEFDAYDEHEGVSVLDAADEKQLDEAISRYNEPQYKQIRRELAESNIKYGLV